MTNKDFQIFRKKRRKWFNTLKETLVCAKCGFDFLGRPECCDFHHKDPKTKFKTVGAMVDSDMKRLVAEIQKCIPLCANCHRTVTYGK